MSFSEFPNCGEKNNFGKTTSGSCAPPSQSSLCPYKPGENQSCLSTLAHLEPITVSILRSEFLLVRPGCIWCVLGVFLLRSIPPDSVSMENEGEHYREDHFLHQFSLYTMNEWRGWVGSWYINMTELNIIVIIISHHHNKSLYMDID